VLAERRLRLRLSDGSIVVRDFSRLDGGVFERFTEPRCFSRVRLGDDGHRRRDRSRRRTAQKSLSPVFSPDRISCRIKGSYVRRAMRRACSISAAALSRSSCRSGGADWRFAYPSDSNACRVDN
jgi:hypothetical protein